MGEETSFRLSEVPAFLQSSALYLTFLQNEDSEIITLPTKHCAFNLLVDTPEELNSALSTLHFWGSYEIPGGVFEFILNNDRFSNEQVLNTFSDLSFKTIDVLLAINNVDSRDQQENNYLGVALQSDSVLLVQHLEERGLSVDTLLGQMCEAGKGSIECLRYLHSIGGKLDHTVVDAAIQSKSLECLQYCLNQNCKQRIRPYHLERAAINGDLPILQYLRSRCNEWSPRVCLYAAEARSLECLKYAHESSAPWDMETFEAAVLSGSLEMVQYLHEQQCPPSRRLCEEAAAVGDLTILVFLHEHGYALDFGAGFFAVSRGHLDCFKYVHAQGWPLTDGLIEEAAVRGHLNILQYAAEMNVLGPNYDFCLAAARNNHADVLIFLHQHGCTLLPEAICSVAIHGNLESMEYIIEEGCPGLQNVSLVAAEHNQLEVLKLLWAHGGPIYTHVNRVAALHGNLQCLQFLHEEGFPLCKEVCLNAIAGDHFDCFKYAVLHGCPVDGEVEEAANRFANKAFITFLHSDYILIEDVPVEMSESDSDSVRSGLCEHQSNVVLENVMNEGCKCIIC